MKLIVAVLTLMLATVCDSNRIKIVSDWPKLRNENKVHSCLVTPAATPWACSIT